MYDIEILPNQGKELIQDKNENKFKKKEIRLLYCKNNN